MKEEQWSLGPASARVLRMHDSVVVELRGVVTAQAYEALHMRLTREPARELCLIVSGGALLAATPRSLAEAAGRGTRIGDAGRVTLIVSRERLTWGRYHLIACRHEGLSWRLDLAHQSEVARAL